MLGFSGESGILTAGLKTQIDSEGRGPKGLDFCGSKNEPPSYINS
jgi:hypothetical protein